MRIAAFVFALSIPFAALADEEALHFKGHGFSIKQLPTRGTASPVQVLLMSLPAEGGFAANVNVQMQPYADSIDDYLKLSKAQFAQLGFKLSSEKKLGPDAIALEYSGQMQGRELHWYARAYKVKGKPIVYLVTATAAAEQWPTVGATLKASVESFKLD